MILLASSEGLATGETLYISTFPIDIMLESESGITNNVASFQTGSKVVIRLHRVVTSSVPQGQHQYTRTFGPPVPVMEFTSDDIAKSILGKKLDRSGGAFGISAEYVPNNETVIDQDFVVRIF
jgi:hypothetical protein